MANHLLQCADEIDRLRNEVTQLRLRGARLVQALDQNDGTIPAAWKISNAVAAWQEYSDA